jgi:MFS transporter, DHA1 family, tetracycline resistance protein
MSLREKNILPILFVTLLLDMVGIGMLIPIIPSLFTNPDSPSFLLQGYSHVSQYIIAGLVTALFGLMQFIAAPILGELSDVYGRKRLLTLGVGVLAIAQLLFATGIAVGSLALLLVSRAIAGIAGANFSIAQAAIADVTIPENRARNFGLIGAAFGLGFIIGPFLGGLLAGATGNPAIPFICAGVLGIVNVLFITLMLPETNHARSVRTQFSLLKGIRNIKVAFNDVDVRPVYFTGFLTMLGFGCFTSFVSVFLVDSFSFTETAAGTYFAVVGMWMVFTQAVVVRIMTRTYSEREILSWSLFVLSAVLVTYPFVGSVTLLYALMPLMAGSVGLSTTSIPSLISKGVSKERQGAALGIHGSMQALSQATAPLIAGVTSGLFGVTVPFILGGIFVMSAWCIIPLKKYLNEP